MAAAFTVDDFADTKSDNALKFDETDFGAPAKPAADDLIGNLQSGDPLRISNAAAQLQGQELGMLDVGLRAGKQTTLNDQLAAARKTPPATTFNQFLPANFTPTEEQRENARNEVATKQWPTVDALGADAGPVLKGPTPEDISTLTGLNPQGRTARNVSSVVSAPAGVANSFLTPEGALMFASPAAGAAFVAQMATSVPADLGKAAGHYSAGDVQSGDDALISGLTTAGMLALPAAFAKKKIKLDDVVGAQKAAELRQQVLSKQLAGQLNREPVIPAESPTIKPPTREVSNAKIGENQPDEARTFGQQEQIGDPNAPQLRTGDEPRVQVSNAPLRQPQEPRVEPVSPHDYAPALLVDGKPIVGGDSHSEIATKAGADAVRAKDDDRMVKIFDALDEKNDAQHVFVKVDEKGNMVNPDEWFSRGEMAKKLNHPKGDKFQSSDLRELKDKTPKPVGVTSDLSKKYDYTSEDLKRYQELKSAQASTPEAEVNQSAYNERAREIEKIRNKYNGNPPKQLDKGATEPALKEGDVVEAPSKTGKTVEATYIGDDANGNAMLVSHESPEIITQPKENYAVPERGAETIPVAPSSPNRKAMGKGISQPEKTANAPQSQESELQVEGVTPLDPKTGAPLEKPVIHTPLGAATPKEFEPVKQYTTSNKNAKVDEDRAARGLPPIMSVARQDWPTVWDDAMQRIDEDANVSQRLENEIYQSGKPVNWLDTDTQNALLLHRRIETTNALDKALHDLNQHIADGFQDGIDEARVRASQLTEERDRIDHAVRVLGTQLGRGLNARKMMAKEDYTLAAMETKMRAAKKGDLTDDERKQIADLNKKISEQRDRYEKHIKELEDKLKKEPLKQAVEEMKTEADQDKSFHKNQGEERDLQSEQESLIEGLQKKADEGKKFGEVGNWIQKLAKLFVAMGERDADKLTDKVHDVIKDIFPDATREDTQDAISGYGQFKELSKDEISVEFRRMKGELQQLGKIEDMKNGQAPLKTGVERRTPSQLERTRIKIVNEMKRRLGLEVTDPAKQLQSALGAIKTRLQHQIDDLDLQISSGKKILKTKTPTIYDAEANALKAKRDELKKQFDEVFGKPELTDEQRIAMANASLDRQIEEVKRQFQTGEIFPKGKQPSKTPRTAELDAKRAELDALQEQRKYLRELLQPKPERDPVAIALQSAKTRLKNRTADLQNRMARGDYDKKPRAKVQLDKAGMEMQAKYEESKLQFDREVMRRRLEGRSTYEKAMDGLSKWRRAFVLTYPTILGKLSSASLELIGITPAEEAVGSLVRQVIPKVAEKAPRYGKGFEFDAEVEALTHTWKTLFTAAGQKLRTGKSDIDTIYGDDRLVPQELKDFILNAHSALKEPARQNEFIRSYGKRLRDLNKIGADITDPMVQMKAGIGAYKDANSKIFMENNAVADMVNRALSRLTQKDPATGEPTWSNKAAETLIRYELPIIKIPLNLVKRAFEYSFGLGIGSVRLGRALSKGLDNLEPEQADIIMRNLARGSLGAAVFALGYFNPQSVGGYYQQGQKRGKSDVAVGGLRIYGVNVPRIFIHNPLLEQLQIGSTVRRVMDSKLRGTKEKQGLISGATAAYGGLIEETPFVQQAEESLKALNPAERQQFFGELMKSTIPGVVQWTAQQMDQPHLTPRKFITGTATPRKPVTALDYLKTAIPVERETVPMKKQ